MFRLNRSYPWVRFTSLSILGLLLTTAPGFSTESSQVLSIKANSAADQIILELSSPEKASLISPLENGDRYLLIDIPEASLAQLKNKQALLNALKSQLPDVSAVTLDEFMGPQPLVRLMVKTKTPGTTGALLSSNSKQLVLQLLAPTVTEPNSDSHATPTPQTTHKSQPDQKKTATNQAASDNSDTVLSAKTTVEVPGKALQRKILEADSLRDDRNHLEGEVKDLKLQIDEQNAMIARLKAEQERLVTITPNLKENQDLIKLQKELKELGKSYNELQQNAAAYRNEIKVLESQLEQAQQQDKGLTQKLAAADGPSFHFSATAENRGGLLNTLDTLTQPEISKLIDAEKDFRLGKKYELDGKTDKAQASYQKAIELAPQVQQYAIALGDLYMNQNEYAKADQVFQAALQYHPDNTDLLNELGKTALLEKNDKTALGYFSKAIPAGVLSNYASTLRHTNKMNEAETIYKLAISLRPGDSDLQFNLGNLYLHEKHFPEAEERFSEAIKLNPEFPEAHFHLGLTYAEEGKSQLAINELNHYLKLMPNAPNKQQVQGYIQDLQSSAKNTKSNS